MQPLIEAAFRSAFTPADHAALMIEIAAMLVAPASPPQTFGDLFIPAISRTDSGGWGIAAANDMPDGRGVSLFWQTAAGHPASQQDIRWGDLLDFDPPPEADPYQAHLMRHRAKALWGLVTARFEQRIQSGEVGLYGRRGSVFEEPAVIPLAAAPHTSVRDWTTGIITVAGEQVFDVQVIPAPDPDTAYVEAVVAFANMPSEMVTRIIGRLYPTGVPSRNEVPDHQVLNKISAEIRRLNRDYGLSLVEPSNSTMLRAAGRKK